MLWAILALYLFGSSGASPVIDVLDHVKESIKEDIEDKNRRNYLLSVVNEAEKVTKEEFKGREKITKELLKLAEKHDSTKETIEPIVAKLHAGAETYQHRMIQFRFALKDKMSREEWTRVFPKVEVNKATK